MAEIHLTKTLLHPPEQVYAAYRDRLDDLPAYLPNVESIELISREETGPDTIHQVARWQGTAKGNVPTMARPFVSKDSLAWVDHATWHAAELACEWRFEFPSMGAGVECGGRNWYEADADGNCVMNIRGTLRIDLAKIRGVPRFAKGLGPKVEKMVLERVRPNMEKVTDAVGSLLSATRDGS